MVMAPIVRGRKGEYGKQFEELRAEGFTRVKVDGEVRLLEEEIVLDKKYKHDIAVVVDRLVMKPDSRKRLADSVETAVALADGILEIETLPRDGGAGRWCTTFSERFACLHCGISMPELEPRIFSFNSPHGACPRCTGLGLADGDRPRAGGARPVAVDRRGRDPAVGERRVDVLRPDHAGDRRALRDRPRGARGRTCRRSSRTCSCTARTATGSTSRTATGWGASAPT